MVQQPFAVQGLVITRQTLQEPYEKPAVILVDGGGHIKVVEASEVAGQFDRAVSVGVLDASDFPSSTL